jgi:salicylate hydroxylase
MQATAMAFEDAATLARLLARTSRTSQIPTFLQAYSELRQPRAQRICTFEFAMSPFASLPVWDPSSTEFPTEDAFMEAHYCRSLNMLGCELSGVELWDAVSAIWANDSEETADEWWQTTGRIGEHAKSSDAVGIASLAHAMQGVAVTVA